jgi:transcription antitermination protein NusB
MSIKTERHRAREIAVGTIYSLDLNSNLPPSGDWILFQGLNDDEIDELSTSVKVYARFLIEGTVQHLGECDDLISSYSKNRPIDMIDAVDRSILRISFFQLLYDRETHPTIIIDEAVKLSQELSNDVSFKFINGILDAYVKGQGK